jgi:hypothetical protein
MKLSELIAAYGDEQVHLQNLDQCAINFSRRKDGIIQITFGTEQSFDLNGTKQLGLVVWMDRDRVAEIRAAPSPEDEPNGGV